MTNQPIDWDEYVEQSTTEKLQDIGTDCACKAREWLKDIDVDMSDISDQAIIFTTMASELNWDTPQLWEKCNYKEETLTEKIEFEKGLTKTTNLDNPQWTDDHREGYVDGLSRAIELLQEEN